MEKLKSIIEKNKEMAEPTLVVRKGNEMNEDLLAVNNFVDNFFV